MTEVWAAEVLFREQPTPEAKSAMSAIPGATGWLIQEGQTFCQRIAELEKTLADLYEGRTCVLPKTREHALNMLTVAEALVHGRPNVEPLT